MGLTRRTFVAGAAASAVVIPAAFGQLPKRIRKPINQLSNTELDYFRRGVHEMMRRNFAPEFFKLSWEFQANIHGVELTRQSFVQLPHYRPYWNQCQHGNLFFLPWHRMYLYFFERILASLSGNPSFGLPYWPYDDFGQGMLPYAFQPERVMTNATEDVMLRSNPLARTRRPFC